MHYGYTVDCASECASNGENTKKVLRIFTVKKHNRFKNNTLAKNQDRNFCKTIVDSLHSDFNPKFFVPAE